MRRTVGVRRRLCQEENALCGEGEILCETGDRGNLQPFRNPLRTVHKPRNPAARLGVSAEARDERKVKAEAVDQPLNPRA